MEFRRMVRRDLIVPYPSKSNHHSECHVIAMLGINKFDGNGRLSVEIYSPRWRGLAHPWSL
jgi:hypothetical protein